MSEAMGILKQKGGLPHTLCIIHFVMVCNSASIRDGYLITHLKVIGGGVCERRLRRASANSQLYSSLVGA